MPTPFVPMRAASTFAVLTLTAAWAQDHAATSPDVFAPNLQVHKIGPNGQGLLLATIPEGSAVDFTPTAAGGADGAGAIPGATPGGSPDGAGASAPESSGASAGSGSAAGSTGGIAGMAGGVAASHTALIIAGVTLAAQ